MNSVIKIGDEFDCKAYGKVKVVDVFKSSITNTEIYEVATTDEVIECRFYATANELDDYENKPD